MSRAYTAPKPKDVWIDLTPRPKCGARKRNGQLCRMPAGEGTDHPGYGTCRRHLGATKTHTKKAALIEAQEHMVAMGLPLEVDPMDAILTCIKITAGEVVYCTQKVQDLTPKQVVVRKKSTKTHVGGEDGDWEEVEKGTDVNLNIWISARHDAMDRLAKFSKMAIDCGIAERQVKVAETTGMAIGRLLQTVMAELNLTDEQKAIAPDVIQRNLVLLEATTLEEV